MHDDCTFGTLGKTKPCAYMIYIYAMQVLSNYLPNTVNAKSQVLQFLRVVCKSFPDEFSIEHWLSLALYCHTYKLKAAKGFPTL